MAATARLIYFFHLGDLSFPLPSMAFMLFVLGVEFWN